MAMLELVGVTKSFGKLTAVNDVNLSVDQGELRGLIGPNGSGKTTLFNLITGFLRPTKGKIIWKGEDITQQPPHTKAEKGIIRTFQITSLLKDMTAAQNVTIAHHLHLGISLFQQFLGTRRIRDKERLIEQKTLEILENLGIADLRDEIAGNLPHGHQEALALGIAMAAEPELLLLDEPVTGIRTGWPVTETPRLGIGGLEATVAERFDILELLKHGRWQPGGLRRVRQAGKRKPN